MTGALLSAALWACGVEATEIGTAVGVAGAVGVGVALLVTVLLVTAVLVTAAGLCAPAGTVAGRLRRARPDDGLLRTPDGRIPVLGQTHGPGPAEGPDPPPAYIERDAAPRLRAALTGGSRFVLVVGEPGAGRTRLAYEVTRALHPRHAFVHPLTRAALPGAVRAAARRRRAVLWLDDLEEHLGADGLTEARLAGARAAVVVATMRAEEYRRYTAREGSRLTGSDGDVWRAQRDLLRRAAVVHLARRWSPEERRRAEAHREDPRIARALRSGTRSGTRSGIAELLAEGPRSLAAWESGWAPGTHPRGAAVVAAAVDCRRAGLRRPVRREWLGELHPRYLSGRGGAELRPEPFAEAMDWACAAAYARPGLLTGDRACGYTALGHLLNAPGLAPVPDHLWRSLLARTDPEDAYEMGLAAHREGRLARAAEALARARRSGLTGAELPLAVAVGDAGHPRRAAADLAGIARRREVRLGPHHPDTLAARHHLAFFTGEAGSARAAAARFTALAADAVAALGPGHPDTLAARHQLAYFTGQAGDRRSAARQLEALLSDRLRLQGPSHPQSLAVRRGLLWFRPADPADSTELERQLAGLLADTERALGPDDPHTLAVRGSRAALVARTGRAAEAERAWAALVADRTRVLGPDHPHVVHTRLERARALAAGGRRAEAGALAARVLAEATPFLEPGHPHLRLARELDAAFRAPDPGPARPRR
ncbi:tetratricopeptide repeat protein [Streptomyces sp. NPDC051567]|uniref:tetratricopeptide repeat protein n=1 Tax=Streptomyces sp. NPDC051567 TaxID=3365660 RepID=UPI0037BAE730